MGLITISVKSDVDKLIRKLDKASSELKDKVIVRSLNRVGNMTMTRLPRDIKARGYNIKQGKVKAAMRKRLADSGSLAFTITGSKKQFSLKEFGAKGLRTAKPQFNRDNQGRIKSITQKGSGVSVKVKDGRSKLRHAFIGPNGHAYENTGKASGAKARMANGFEFRKQKIKKLFGPSAADMMHDDRVAKITDETVQRNLAKRIEHEMSRLIK